MSSKDVDDVSGFDSSAIDCFSNATTNVDGIEVLVVVVLVATVITASAKNSWRCRSTGAPRP
jgi:hypothetical protein